MECDDCWVRTITDYEDIYIPEQIDRIKQLQKKDVLIKVKRSDKGDGVVNCAQDLVANLSGIAEKRSELLAVFDIRHVSNIAGLSDEDIIVLHREVKG